MVYLVLATMHEARPLIDRYRLVKRQEAHPYPVYAKDEISLIVSGIGKISAAAAVGYLQALSAHGKPAAWLNLGIAGHGDFELGQGFLAHRVEDEATGRRYYPPLVFPFSASTSNLLTVDCPADHYAPDCGYDMEASGFYQSALRCATAEWVQCYKVVSDNPSCPLETFDKTQATVLMEMRLDEIEALVSTLLAQVRRWHRLDEPDEAFQCIVSRLHFSETRKAQLKRLLQRWRAIKEVPLLSRIDPGDYPTAEALMDDVHRRLAVYRLEV